MRRRAAALALGQAHGTNKGTPAKRHFPMTVRADPWPKITPDQVQTAEALLPMPGGVFGDRALAE